MPQNNEVLHLGYGRGTVMSDTPVVYRDLHKRYERKLSNYKTDGWLRWVEVWQRSIRLAHRASNSYNGLMTNNMSTAGGKIQCRRCTALSKRTGVQCGRPASKGSKSQKCHMHGGRGNSTPKTEAGRKRIIDAHTKSGRYTKEAKAEHSNASARLLRLEDAMHVLGMTSAARTRGRKAGSYVPVTSIDELVEMLFDGELHTVGGPVDQ